MQKISKIGVIYDKINDDVQNRKSSYKYVKSEYLKQFRKISKSDFANSPVALNQELKILENLKIKAFAENLMEEGEWIDKRIEEIKKIISTPKVDNIASNFVSTEDYLFSKSVQYNSTKSQIKQFSNKYLEKSKETAMSALSLFQKMGLNLEEAMSAVEALSVKKEDEEKYNISSQDLDCIKNIDHDLGPVADYSVIKNLSMFISHYQDEDKKFIIDNIYKSAKDGMDIRYIVNFILYPLLVEEDEHSEKLVDINIETAQTAIDDYIQVKKDFPGKEDMSFLKKDFEDRPLAMDMLYKLLGKLGCYYKYGFQSFPTAPVISNLLTVKNDNNKYSISKKSVDFVCKLKDILVSTRDNEEKERKSPIALFDNDGFLKINYLINSSIKSDKPIEQLIKEYNKDIGALEDRIIIQFVSDFTDSKGEINNNVARAVINLRGAGITYGSLIELTKSCINKDGSLNISKLKTICQLKKAGALSKDIKDMVDACKKDENGNILQSDADICSALSSVYVNGQNIIKTLPEYRKHPEYLDILAQYADTYKKDNCQLSGHYAENKNGIIDEYSLEILNSIYKAEETEPKFNYEVIKNIMALCKDDNGRASEEAADICSIMTKNNESPENILSALKICSDEKGNFDKTLTNILWLLSEDKTYFEITEKIINACRLENGEINHKKAEYIEKLLKDGESPVGIMNILVS